MNLMKLIDDTNRATTVPDSEQWTIRGWPNRIAIFHRDNCQCCNEYAVHVVHTCREQDIDLPLQAVGDSVTMALLGLMHDLKSKAKTRSLKDYKDLTNEAASLRAALKLCHDMLACERVS
jgi:hypothetical protein